MYRYRACVRVLLLLLLLPANCGENGLAEAYMWKPTSQTLRSASVKAEKEHGGTKEHGKPVSASYFIKQLKREMSERTKKKSLARLEPTAN